MEGQHQGPALASHLVSPSPLQWRAASEFSTTTTRAMARGKTTTSLILQKTQMRAQNGLCTKIPTNVTSVAGKAEARTVQLTVYLETTARRRTLVLENVQIFLSELNRKHGWIGLMIV